MRAIARKLIPFSIRTFYHRMRRKLQKKMQHIPAGETVQFNTETVYNGQFAVSYRGISALRCPFDYVMYQMIISSLKPDLVIEIGTNSGGGTLYLADLMDALGHGTLHSIDIEDRTPEIVRKHPRIQLFKHGWERYDLAEASRFARILVIDDASHMYEDVAAVLRKFSPLVCINSYFIVEDGIIDEIGQSEQYHGGPLRAIREFLKVNKNFEVDRRYCDMFGRNATSNVNGYLMRIV